MGLFSRFFKNEDIEADVPVPPRKLPKRNELCWCGSGLKYKKCHLEQDQLYLAKQREKEPPAKKVCSSVFG